MRTQIPRVIIQPTATQMPVNNLFKMSYLQQRLTGAAITQALQNGTVFYNEVTSGGLEGQAYELFAEIYDGILFELQNSVINYSLGQFDLVQQDMTTNKFNEYAALLNDNDYKTIPVVNNYRVFLLRILDGFKRTILINDTLNQKILDLSECEARCAILDDMDLLRQYLADRSRQVSLFGELNKTLELTAIIKPQYAEYIRLYGFPEGGIFESQKLADIIAAMVADGTLTETEVYRDFVLSSGFTRNVDTLDAFGVADGGSSARSADIASMSSRMRANINSDTNKWSDSGSMSSLGSSNSKTSHASRSSQASHISSSSYTSNSSHNVSSSDSGSISSATSGSSGTSASSGSSGTSASSGTTATSISANSEYSDISARIEDAKLATIVRDGLEKTIMSRNRDRGSEDGGTEHTQSIADTISIALSEMDIGNVDDLGDDLENNNTPLAHKTDSNTNADN